MQSTRIIFSGGLAEITVMVVMLVAKTCRFFLGMSRTLIKTGKFVLTISSIGGVAFGSHFAERICSSRSSAWHCAASTYAEDSACFWAFTNPLTAARMPIPAMPMATTISASERPARLFLDSLIGTDDFKQGSCHAIQKSEVPVNSLDWKSLCPALVLS